MGADHSTPTLELVSRLASGVAHDLSNLVTVIAGRCALAERVISDELLRRNLEVIRETAARAGDLADQLRAFARRQRVDRRSVDIHELLRQMEGVLREALGDRVALVVDAGAAGADALVDPQLLGQALRYLASVARDGMAGEGRFTIATAGPASRPHGASTGRWLRLRVSDTGSPLLAPSAADAAPPGAVADEAALTRLLEPFVTLAGRKRGPGLRLAAALGIVEQLGGALELESAADGRIAFAIYLPAAEAGA